MASFLAADFGDSDSDGGDFNPAQQVDSDDEDIRKPSRQDRKQQSKNRSKDQKKIKSAATIEDSDDEDDDDDDDENPTVAEDAPQDEDEKDEDEDEIEANGQGDDGEEEDEDEDEEDEDDRPRKRKKRTGHMQFIDEEAEVDDEDEEEELEEEEGLDETHPDDLADVAVGGENDDYRHRQLDRQRERMEEVNIEEQARRLRDKYGRQKVNIAEQSGVPQHLLLPSSADPSIWGIKCKPGKEYEVVNSILKRFAERLGTPGAINISSAFARPNSMSGYVYIEARKQAEVTKATENMTFAYASQLTLIPQGEMPDLLRVRKPKVIKAGDFVRIKRPPKYAGDLAQVELVEETQSEVTVRIVPRLDFRDANDSRNDSASKRKRPGMAAVKPPAKHFWQADATKLRTTNKYANYSLGIRGKNDFTFNGDDYFEGFLIKTLRMNAIETENVNPTLEEASKFAMQKENEDGTQRQEIDLSAIAASLKDSTADFVPGDAVEIFSGEQQGVKGKAVSVLKDVVTIRVDDGPLKGQRIEAPVKIIRKLFDVGDNVKVLQNSKYRGEVGTVLKITDDKVTLLTDSNKQEITVLSRDLRVALDTTGPLIASKYSLFDLIQLDAATVGCIVKVDPETVKVLDQNGNLRTMLPSTIAGKIESRRPTVATDRLGSEVRKEDLVQENAGAQRKGIVLHIHRNFLFLEDKMVVENNGIFVVKSSTVNVVSAKGARQNEGPNFQDMNPALLKQQGSFGMLAPPKPGMNNRQMAMRNRLDGQKVMIAKGPQKGLIGRIKDATNINARVEFMNKPGLHMFKLEMLKVEQKSGEWVRLDGTRTDNRGPAPRVPGAARVPAGAMDGNRSVWGNNNGVNGSATPYWKNGGMDGSRTPAFASGSRTSIWEGSRTVNPYADGSRTAYGDWGAGSRTPAPYSAPTPGASAPTPGPMDAPTPGAYLGITPGPIDAPTPRVPYMYGTPAASAPTPGAFAVETPGAFSAETPGAFADDDDDEPRYG